MSKVNLLAIGGDAWRMLMLLLGYTHTYAHTHTHIHTHTHTHTYMACQGFFHCIGSDWVYLDIHKRSATAVVADELCLLLIKTVYMC